MVESPSIKSMTFGRKHEKAAVDHPAIALRLFLERLDTMICRDIQRTETPRRISRRQRRQVPLRTMECDQIGDVHIANAIPVGKAKILFAEIRPHA